MSAVEPSRDLDRLRELVAGGGVLVLSGAGLSTESGIPDYRGPRPSGVSRPSPMTWSQFRDSEPARRRYWARSHLGWAVFGRARPNAGHEAVAHLQRAGLVDHVITQNVDGLHQSAGSAQVLDLHGRLDRVVCLGCGTTSPRARLHERLADANPTWTAEAAAWLPDGDVALPAESVDSFVPVGCEDCGDGVLKPDVVFFGESIPRAVNEQADRLVDGASSVLVLGSSLTVFSGRRLVVRAARAGAGVAIVNRGPTRADGLADVRIDAGLGETLSWLGDSACPVATAPPIR